MNRTKSVFLQARYTKKTMQIIIKIIFIFLISYTAIFLSIKIWRMDIDVKEFINPIRWFHSSIEDKTSWIPQREKNAIYQGNQIVGYIHGIEIDHPEKTCLFYEIHNANNFDRTKEFEYQNYKLKLVKYEQWVGLDTSNVSKGNIYKKVLCDITGTRDFSK